MGLAAESLRQHRADPIYGTERLIERDTVTALAWARESWACIVFNLHVEHRGNGPLEAAAAFRGLIDCALECGGSFYLTYHRWARPEQLAAAHPTLRAVLARTRELDPHGIFQSDWYRLIEGNGILQYGEGMLPFIQAMKTDIPLKRMGTEAECAAAVTFLLSPAAAYITGETIKVDGAYALWRKTWDIEDHDNAPPPYVGFVNDEEGD